MHGFAHLLPFMKTFLSQILLFSDINASTGNRAEPTSGSNRNPVLHPWTTTTYCNTATTSSNNTITTSH